MTEKTARPYQFLSREWLKVLAMVFMLLDHAYMTVVAAPGFGWMTQVGRLAFPLFAFQVAEGYTHTSSKKGYFRNMAIFALIAELPYNLMMGGELLGPFHQSVMVTFLLALCFLALIDKTLSGKLPPALKGLAVAGLCLLSVLAGTLAFVDYSGFGVLTVLLFYLAGRLPSLFWERAAQVAGLWVINGVFLGGKVLIFPNGWEFPEQGLALLSLPLIWLYNGRKALSGRRDKVFKFFGYWFYPGHILLLSLIALYG